MQIFKIKKSKKRKRIDGDIHKGSELRNKTQVNRSNGHQHEQRQISNEADIFFCYFYTQHPPGSIIQLIVLVLPLELQSLGLAAVVAATLGLLLVPAETRA